MTEKAGTDLIEARVIREEDWALEAFRARLTYPDMRRRAILPPEQGGLGYAISEPGLKALVAQARRRHGEVAATRDERIERQGIEIDARARAARFDLERAHAELLRPAPERAEYGDSSDYRDALASYHKGIEAAGKLVESADRRLAAAMKDERDLLGLNAPTRIEADVTTHDAIVDELNAALAALDDEKAER